MVNNSEGGWIFWAGNFDQSQSLARINNASSQINVGFSDATLNKYNSRIICIKYWKYTCCPKPIVSTSCLLMEISSSRSIPPSPYVFPPFLQISQPQSSISTRTSPMEFLICNHTNRLPSPKASSQGVRQHVSRRKYKRIGFKHVVFRILSEAKKGYLMMLNWSSSASPSPRSSRLKGRI